MLVRRKHLDGPALAKAHRRLHFHQFIPEDAVFPIPVVLEFAAAHREAQELLGAAFHLIDEELHEKRAGFPDGNRFALGVGIGQRIQRIFHELEAQLALLRLEVLASLIEKRAVGFGEELVDIHGVIKQRVVRAMRAGGGIRRRVLRVRQAVAR